MAGIRLAYLDVPSYNGCFPGLGLLFSSSFPITACFTVKGLGGTAELCFRALVTSQRKSVQRVGNTEHGTLAWAAGSGVSQHRCLVLSGAKSDAGLRAEASGCFQSYGVEGIQMEGPALGVSTGSTAWPGVQLPRGLCAQGTGRHRGIPANTLCAHGLHPCEM